MSHAQMVILRLCETHHERQTRENAKRMMVTVAQLLWLPTREKAAAAKAPKVKAREKVKTTKAKARAEAKEKAKMVHSHQRNLGKRNVIQRR